MRDSKNDKSKSKKWFKVGAWVLGIALFLFVGLFFFTSWLESKIERTVQERSNGVYSLQLYGFGVSPFIGNLSIDSLTLKPDYERWQQLSGQHEETPATLLDLSTHEVELEGISVLKLIFSNKAQVDLLAIAQPRALLTQMRTDTTTRQKPLHETLSGMAKGMEIGEIDITGATVRYRQEVAAENPFFSLEQFDLQVDDLQLDSQSYRADDRAYYAKLIALKARQAEAFLPNGFYRFRTDSIQLNTQQQLLTLQNIRSEALLSAAQMSERKGEAVGLIDVKVPLLRLTGINYAAQLRDKRFLATHLLVDGVEFSAFKDKKHFDNKPPKPLPHDIVQNVPIMFSIDTVTVENMYARYEELAEEAKEPGHVFFDNLGGTITNLSNIPEQMTMEHPAVLQASALLMGKMPLSLQARLPLLAQNGYHTLEAELGEGQLTILNPILERTNFITVESGHVQRGFLQAELTNKSAKGTMRVIYRNFKAELISPGQQQGLGKEILSEIANLIAIQSSNPDDKGEEPRTAEIDVTRDEARSFLSYWKDCAKDGFISIATPL